MLTHVSQSASIIIPVTAEIDVHTVGVVGFERGRSQPAVVVQDIRYGLRGEIGLSDPVEFPVEAGCFADGDGERPSEHAGFDEFLDRFGRHLHSIEILLEAEPGIEPEHASVLLYSFYEFLSFADRPGHGFLTPDVLTGADSVYRNDPVPVRRGGDVNDVDLGQGQQFFMCVKGLDTSTDLLGSCGEVGLIDIADGHHTGARVRNMSTPHATDTNDAFGELVARRDESLTDHMSGNDHESCRQGGSIADEIPPRLF